MKSLRKAIAFPFSCLTLALYMATVLCGWFTLQLEGEQ